MAIILKSNLTKDLDLVDVIGENSPLFNRNLASIKALSPKGELTILVESTLSNLSKDVYGSVDYSWIIGIYNGVTDDDLVPGMVLYYPDIEQVRYVIQ